MAMLEPVKLPNGVVVYMGVQDELADTGEELEATDVPPPPGEPVAKRRPGNGMRPKGGEIIEGAVDRAKKLTRAIEGIAAMIPTAFKNAGGAEVEKVTLSFGIKAGGKAGIPLVTEGSAEGSIGVVLECRYPVTNKNETPSKT